MPQSPSIPLNQTILQPGRTRLAIKRLDASPLAALLIAVFIFMHGFASILTEPDPFHGHGTFILNFLPGWYFPYRMHHGRPLETCPSFDDERQQLMQDHRKRLDAVHQTWMTASQSPAGLLARTAAMFDKARGVFAAFGESHSRLLALQDKPCAGPWEYHNHFELTHKWFNTQSPFIWLYENYNISPFYGDIILGLTQILGAMCLFYVARRICGSNLAGLSGYLICASITLWPPIGWHALFLTMFPLILITQIMSSRRLAAAWPPLGRLAAEAGLALLFGLASIAPFLSYPPQYRVVPQLMLASMIAVALVKRHWRGMARAAAMAAAFLVITTPINEPGKYFAPVAAVNHAKNEGFVKMSAFIGMGERPTVFGLPLADMATVGDPPMFCPLLSRAQLDFVMHQTEPAYGDYFIKDLVLHHPLTLVEAIWKRIYLHFAFHKDLLHELYVETPFPFTYQFWIVSFAALCLAAFVMIRSRVGFARLFPVLAATAWSYCGVHTLIFYFHAHDFYSRGGVYTAFCVFPAILTYLVKERHFLADLGPARLLARCKSLTLPQRIVLFTLAACILIPSAAYFIREAIKENHAFHIMYPIQNSWMRTSLHMTPYEVEDNIESIIDLGHNAPGAAEMHGAQSFFAMRVWRYAPTNPPGWEPFGMDRSLLPGYFEYAKERTQKYFNDALKAAPDNPYYPVYATTIESPYWVDIYRQAVRKHPDSPFAPYMLTYLYNRPEFSPEEQRDLARQMIDSLSGLLERTAKYRPGFVRIPGALWTDGQADKRPDGLHLTLAPGGKAVLAPFNTYHSPELKLIYFLKISQGSVDSAVAASSGETLASSPVYALGDDASGRYIAVALANPGETDQASIELTAGSKGASIVIRDVYPLVLRPRLSKN